MAFESTRAPLYPFSVTSARKRLWRGLCRVDIADRGAVSTSGASAAGELQPHRRLPLNFQIPCLAAADTLSSSTMLALPLAVSPAVVRALEHFRRSLEETFRSRLREFVLYGSQARGTAHEESDVDVLVVVDDLSEVERRQAIDLAYDANVLDRDEWVGISPLVHSTKSVQDLRERERLIMRNIAQEGIWLHGVPPATTLDRSA